MTSVVWATIGVLLIAVFALCVNAWPVLRRRLRTVWPFPAGRGSGLLELLVLGLVGVAVLGFGLLTHPGRLEVPEFDELYARSGHRIGTIIAWAAVNIGAFVAGLAARAIRRYLKISAAPTALFGSALLILSITASLVAKGVSGGEVLFGLIVATMLFLAFGARR